MTSSKREKITIMSLLVTLGIVYGDIGTSPLYTMSAIIGQGNIIEIDEVFGAISLIFWTLTIQTSIKYIMITLSADNNGEGGIFSLYTLVRDKAKWLIIPAIIGGAALLADSLLTPALTVTSSIEGLSKVLNITDGLIIVIVIMILTFIFFLQRLGTGKIGKLFGPVMLIWFCTLGLIGVINIAKAPEILLALNPMYGLKLLVTGPKGIFILGAVFLCTTGAEALYTDLGHCGKRNIRISWIFVKLMLVLTYLGQGAYLIQMQGTPLSFNPFYEVVSDGLVVPLVFLSAAASIIASQALISGAFTLVSEAAKLDLFPRLKEEFPSTYKGQLYIPFLNSVLWLGTIALVLIFRNSQNMEAAYGLAITITMLSTTVLLFEHLIMIGVNAGLRYLFLVVFVSIESVFLFANLGKIMHGGYITLLIMLLIVGVMVIWYVGYKIKLRYHVKTGLKKHLAILTRLQNDPKQVKVANNLVYFTNVEEDCVVEKAVIYSLLNRRPKRADNYWFVHVNTLNEPYGYSYRFIPFTDHIFKVMINIGFKENQQVSILLKSIIKQLIESGELEIAEGVYGLDRKVGFGDFKFIILEDDIPAVSDLTIMEKWILTARIYLKHLTIDIAKWYGLEHVSVERESIPLYVNDEFIKVDRIP